MLAIGIALTIICVLLLGLGDGRMQWTRRPSTAAARAMVIGAIVIVLFAIASRYL